MTDISVVGSRAVELAADLALVALNAKDVESNDRGTHALELISQIVHEARCPVIAVIENENPEFIARAASSGISAYACPIGHDEVMGAVNVALGRFLEHRDLEAFQRRAVIERAKGILMERNLIDEREAFERLRNPQLFHAAHRPCGGGATRASRARGSARRDQRRSGGPTPPARPEGEILRHILRYLTFHSSYATYGRGRPSSRRPSPR